MFQRAPSVLAPHRKFVQVYPVTLGGYHMGGNGCMLQQFPPFFWSIPNFDGYDGMTNLSHHIRPNLSTTVFATPCYTQGPGPLCGVILKKTGNYKSY